MSAQGHAQQKLLEVRIRAVRLRAHAGATKHPPGPGTATARTIDTLRRTGLERPTHMKRG
jgi:hypothetical protein